MRISNGYKRKRGVNDTSVRRNFESDRDYYVQPQNATLQNGTITSLDGKNRRCCSYESPFIGLGPLLSLSRAFWEIVLQLFRLITFFQELYRLNRYQLFVVITESNPNIIATDATAR